MSLFASSFESGTTAGPSSLLGQGGGGGKNNNKRKRPSNAAAPANSDDQLRAAQKNLEKLMKAVETGGPVGKPPKEPKYGGDEMGLPAKKQKQQKQQQKDGKRHDDRSAAPAAAKKRNLGKRERLEALAKASPSTSAQMKQQDSASTPLSKKEKKKAKQAVEIPLQPSPVVKGEDAAGLTSLQKGMKSKLEGARFRWINEQLYSTPSTEAVAMMKKDPKIFADYHQAHRTQTAAWPSPPLPYIIERIHPLPKGTVVADLGCGDAGLARALVPKGKVVLSYDLVGDNGVDEDDAKISEGWVVQADFLTHIPLPGRPGGGDEEQEQGKKKGKGKAGSEIVDVVVCCLSLMGTNWVGGIHEACRVMKQGGTLHIAEVTSRFTSTEAFVEMVESFGFELNTEESPSTHFTLFQFTKTPAVSVGPVPGQQGWNERLRAGEEILQACVYKKR